MKTSVQTLAPVVIFAYNRPQHLRRTIDALAGNHLASETNVTIYCDGPKTEEVGNAIDEVRNVAYSARGFKNVRVRVSDENRGLSRSIIDGVSKVVTESGRVIVVEDDIVTSPWFLTYMNQGLALYENETAVASIHGYTYPVRTRLPDTFFLRGADCWGWATWKRAWDVFEMNGSALLKELTDRNLENDFDFDGTYDYTRMLRDQIKGHNDSWAIRWHASAFLRGMLTLYPGESLVHNSGNDGSGTHSGGTSDFDTALDEKYEPIAKIPVRESPVAREAFKKYFRRRTRRSIA